MLRRVPVFLRLALVFAITAGVVWGTWYVENRGDPEARAVVSAVDAAQRPVDLPVLMYHSINSRESRAGDYVITPGALRGDLEWLQKNGYHTVVVQDLLNYVEQGTPLPEKPVMITFDDGYYNNYLNAFPILKEMGMKAVISIIGSASDEMSQTLYKNKATCAVTWEELTEMLDAGVWEAQNHTYDLHDLNKGRKGASRIAGESEDAYEAMLKKDLTQLQTKLKKNVGISPDTFTWPFGAYTKDCRKLLQSMGFRASLSCNGGVNHIQKGDTEGLFLLKRNLRTPRTSITKCLQD